MQSSPLSVQQRTVLLIAAVIGFISAFWFYRYSANLTPEKIMQSLFDLSAPTRFVLIDDQKSNNVAVVDLIAQTQITTLHLQAHPDFWSISPSGKKLFYAQVGTKHIYSYHTATHAKHSYTLPHPVELWQYNDIQHRLIVVGDGAISVIDTLTDHIHTYTDIAPNSTHIRYDAYLQTLWLISAHQLLAIPLSDTVMSLPKVRTYPLPATWQRIAPLSATPNGLYLIIGATDTYQHNQIALWDMTESRWAKQNIPVPEGRILRPYAGTRGSYLWVLTQSGQGIRVDNAPPHHTAIIKTTVLQSNHIATGWLDQRILISGQQHIAVYNTDTLQPQYSIPTTGAVEDVFITADSKTALFTTAATPTLYTLSIRNGKQQAIPLRDITQPQHILMGATATLCH